MNMFVCLCTCPCVHIIQVIKEEDCDDERHSYNLPPLVIATSELNVPAQVCAVCKRSFRRPGDIKRHKCLEERSKPVSSQSGSKYCPECGRWFRSPGGFAKHKCQQTHLLPSQSDSTPDAVVGGKANSSSSSCCKAHCSQCGRCCKSIRGLQLHCCIKQTRRPTVNQRKAFDYWCSACHRRFRRQSDLSRHGIMCCVSLKNSGHISQNHGNVFTPSTHVTT